MVYLIAEKFTMASKRSRLDLYLSVLNTVRDGVDKPTRIMYATNMSWRPVQKVFDGLLNQGLLSVVVSEGSGKSRRRYSITEKGISVLNYFEGSKELVDIM